MRVAAPSLASACLALNHRPLSIADTRERMGSACLGTKDLSDTPGVSCIISQGYFPADLLRPVPDQSQIAAKGGRYVTPKLGVPMKRQIFSLIACVCLGFLGVGCGVTVDEPTPQADGQSAEENSPEDGASDDGDVTAFAVNCESTCTAVTIGTREDCGTFMGYGSTTVFGGCKKACRKARADARAQARAENCRISRCEDSCN